MNESIKTPQKSPNVQRPLDGLMKLSRVHLFALLSALAVVMVPQGADASDLIPKCGRDTSYLTQPQDVHLNNTEKAKMYCLVDGDTFDVIIIRSGQIIRIRLWAADCPESYNNSKCQKTNCDPSKGQEVTELVRAALSVVRDITLEGPYKVNKPKRKGQKGRMLSYVRLINGTDLSCHLYRGKCHPRIDYRHPRKADYKNKKKSCKKHQYKKKARQRGRQ